MTQSTFLTEDSGDHTVVIYCHDATAEAASANSLAVQEKECRRYAEAHSWPVLETIQEYGSGVSLHRAELDRLRRRVRAGEVRVILVDTIDRLSRSLFRLVELLEEFEKHGVRVVSVTQSGVDTGTPMGRKTIQILGIFTAFERELISEKTRERRRARK